GMLELGFEGLLCCCGRPLRPADLGRESAGPCGEPGGLRTETIRVSRTERGGRHARSDPLAVAQRDVSSRFPSLPRGATLCNAAFGAGLCRSLVETLPKLGRDLAEAWSRPCRGFRTSAVTPYTA